MLAAIGIIIMTKQIHVMLGVIPEKGSLLATMAQIPHSLLNVNPDIAVIGFTSLFILIGWTQIKDEFWNKIPAPLLVVLVGIALGNFFHIKHQHSYLQLPDGSYQHYHDYNRMGSQFLVNLPEKLSASFYFPDFSKAFTLEFCSVVITICLVGSLESLLSTIAIDKLDPYQRRSNLDRDLTAVGVGNLVAGCVGGLPMIADIVRSSANVNNGARTGWANFFHAVLLLLFVVLFPDLIHSIPLAALAALLVYTGYQLASPKSFKAVLVIGTEQFILFVATIIGVLVSNLLVGVLIGILVKLGIQVFRGVWLNNLFICHFTITETEPNTLTVKLNGSALFSNFFPLKKALEQLPKAKTIIFDFSNGYLIEHTVMEFIDHFSHDYEANGGCCKQKGEVLQSFSDHTLAARIMSGKH
jgi:MFS superfamily sulfate permease-like transporter